MASVRVRNGKYYYRATIRDQNGIVHHIEHGSFKTYEEALEAGNFAYPTKRISEPFQMNEHLEKLIFERFPEGHPAHLPLKTIYLTGCTVKEAYDMKIDDVKFGEGIWNNGVSRYKLCPELYRLLQIQKKRIIDSRLIFLYPDKPIYFNVYLNTGKKIKIYQKDYISKIIRREINPYWSFANFTRAYMKEDCKGSEVHSPGMDDDRDGLSEMVVTRL